VKQRSQQAIVRQERVVVSVVMSMLASTVTGLSVDLTASPTTAHSRHTTTQLPSTAGWTGRTNLALNQPYTVW